MYTQLEPPQNILLNSLPFAWQKYEVRELVALFYKASHKKKTSEAKVWFRQLEGQLERLTKRQRLRGSLCSTLQLKWKQFLNNLIQAISMFQVSYKANCPCANTLPSPFITTLKRIEQSATLALFHIEV